MTARDVDAAVAAHAATQAGCFSRRQVLAAGGSDEIARARLRAGTWERVANGVYALPSAPADPTRRLWIPHLALACPSVVAHEAAAELHRLPGFPIGRTTLVVPHGHHAAPAGAVVHQTRDPWPPPTTIVSGLPVTTVAETLLALAAVHRAVRVGHALDHALVHRRTSLPEVTARLMSVRRRGKRGVRALARLLDHRLDGWVPPASELERLLLDATDRAGIVVVRQFPHPGRDLPGRCVDAADVAAKAILEADGRTWHERIDDVRRDHHRDNEALRAGWITIRLGWEELRHDPEGSAQLLADTNAVRRAA